MSVPSLALSGLLLLQVLASGTIAQARSVSLPTPRPQAGSGTTFPVTVEVIPGKLKARIFLHDIKDGNESISCWSYVSEGMVAQKQKEIIFTLRRDPRQKPEDYPHDFLDLLDGIYHFAEDGRLVDVGDVTLFGDTGFMQRDFRGIGYVEPQSLPAVDIPSPALAGIALKGDEALIAWHFSLTRVTALLGMKYRYYPYPTWSDLQRAPVASLKGMDKSPLEMIVKTTARGSYYEEDKHISLVLLPSSRERLQKFLGKLGPDQPIFLRTQVDGRADACLVWSPGQKKLVVIAPAGSTGSRKTGAYLVLLPAKQKATDFQIVEDGYSIFFIASDWQKVREALTSGTDVSIPAASAGGVSFTLEWAKTGYTSPVTGETFMSERWTTYEPQHDSPTKSSGAVSAKKVVLLTSEQELKTRTTAQDLGNYLIEIEKTVEAFFSQPDRKVGRDLSIRLELNASQQPKIQIVAEPGLAADLMKVLHDQLAVVPGIKVSGPVVLDLVISVWGGAAKQ